MSTSLTAADLFDEATKHLGGRLDLVTLDLGGFQTLDRARSYATQIIQAVIDGTPGIPPIHFDFIASHEVNAVAFSHKGRYFVGVTSDAVFAIHLLFRRILSDRRCFLATGEAGAEIEQAVLGEDVLKELFRENLVTRIGAPKDILRSFYCMLLCDLAFLFLVLHEIGHIIDGHVDYWAAKNTSPFLKELGWASMTKNESLIRQCLEVDADCIATSLGGWLADRLCQELRSRTLSDAAAMILNPDLDNVSGRLCAWLIAVFAFFRLFGDERLAGAGLYSSSHPPFRVRCFNAWQYSAFKFVRKDNQVPLDVFKSIFIRAVVEVESAFQVMTTGLCTPRSEYYETWSKGGEHKHFERYYEAWFAPEGVEFRDAMVNCWNGSLRQELLKHAFLPLTTYYSGDWDSIPESEPKS